MSYHKARCSIRFIEKLYAALNPKDKHGYLTTNRTTITAFKSDRQRYLASKPAAIEHVRDHQRSSKDKGGRFSPPA